MSISVDTNEIKNWRSIVTLIVFCITNILVLCPVNIPILFPRRVHDAFHSLLYKARITNGPKPATASAKHKSAFVKLQLPLNLVTAPLIADLFLLAILAIGRQEVHDGTVGADHIAPIDIMVFFFTLAYIAISIDASGLIRYLAFKVLQKGGKNGYALYAYLLILFFGLSVVVGNDPVILSGTAFLAYMTTAARNIENPRAWIYAQFSVANVGSAILVSSNPTNLVLAGAFNIKFVEYTANMIVPVIVTLLVLGPAMYLIFYDKKHSLLPKKITMDELAEEEKNKDPLNPNIPHARDVMEQKSGNGQQIPLEEILNPYLDKRGATVGVTIILITLVVILVMNAVTPVDKEHPVFWVTLPAAVVMFAFDVTVGWLNRHASREAAKSYADMLHNNTVNSEKTTGPGSATGEESNTDAEKAVVESASKSLTRDSSRMKATDTTHSGDPTDKHTHAVKSREQRTDLESILKSRWSWARATFPTATTVLSLLPYALIPFSLAMFVLVQALVTKGWVAVFAHGWNNWVNTTGTVGAIGGMGFVSVLLCNFAGTNIGTAILICRVIQAWVQIHTNDGIAISQRTFWATIYSMAIGLNYGAFSVSFSASLAGLLWRDILKRKHIHVSSLSFARYNLPIIIVAMIVGCTVLVGEVYITRSGAAYKG